MRQSLLHVKTLIRDSYILTHSTLYSHGLRTTRQLQDRSGRVSRFCHRVRLSYVRLFALRTPTNSSLHQINTFVRVIHSLRHVNSCTGSLKSITVGLFPCPVRPLVKQIRAVLSHYQSVITVDLLTLSSLSTATKLSVGRGSSTISASCSRLCSLLTRRAGVINSIRPAILLVLTVHCVRHVTSRTAGIKGQITCVIAKRHS